MRASTGAARTAGIRPGDLVVALNGARLKRVDDFRQAVRRLGNDRPAALLVWRDGRLAYVPVHATVAPSVLKPESSMQQETSR